MTVTAEILCDHIILSNFPCFLLTESNVKIVFTHQIGFDTNPLTLQLATHLKKRAALP